MAYCKQCGAYLPDGQSVCLACGFDEQAKSGSATATQRAKKSQTDTERLRKQMEEQRARVREQSKKWAEQEAQRRKAQQEQEDRQKSEPFVEENETQSHIPYARQGAASSSGTTVSSSKLMAVLSYLSVLCFVPLLACKDDEFAMFHAKQGFSLFIFTSIGNVLGGLLGFGWLFTVAQVFFIIKGIGNANAGIKEPLPYIGTLFKF